MISFHQNSFDTSAFGLLPIVRYLIVSGDPQKYEKVTAWNVTQDMCELITFLHRRWVMWEKLVEEKNIFGKIFWFSCENFIAQKFNLKKIN